ncbi:MAG: PmbA protein, partial [Myxococcota bacterium]
MDGSRRVADELNCLAVGREAAARSLEQIGSEDIPSLTLPILVENRAVGKLLGGLLRPMSGALIDQKQSWLDGKVGEAITGPLLTLRDEPFL